MHSKSELPPIEARLLRMLATGAKTSPAGKDFVCRQLSIIGTEMSVPTLARMLDDPSMAEIARYTLERIPAPSAGAALRNALPKASGNLQAGIINALAERRDAQAVPALKSLLGSPDLAISNATVNALAEIGDAQALAAIKGALATAPADRRESCCTRMSAAPMRIGARDVYRQLSAPGEPPMIRIAALKGWRKWTAGGDPVLEKELGSSNADVQAAVIRLMNGIPGSVVTAIYVKRYAGLTPAGQIRVLTALPNGTTRSPHVLSSWRP